MEFAILGSLELTVGGRPVELRGGKPRALLAMLVMHPNQIVSADRLTEGLWGQTPPPSAPNTLQGYVSNLRQVLAAGAGSDDPPMLRTQTPGYVLAVNTERIDAWQFERLATEGRQALAGGIAERAADAFAEALSLWRGPALADFADQPFAIGEAARLEELRLSAIEDCAEAELVLGRHHELVGRLQAMVDQFPFRERLWGQLMVALYRCGRQAEALRAFQDARRTLGDELGIDPGPLLRRLEADILAQAEHLDWQPPPPRSGRSRRRSAQLADSERHLIGRGSEMAVLDAALARTVGGAGQVVLLSGEPGVGKTRLVEELADRAGASDLDVAWGRCYEGQGAAAFWPWMQVVTGLIDRCDPEMLRVALDPGAGDIAQIVPEVKEIVPGVTLPTVVDVDAARARLYEAVSRLLIRLAAGRPLVLAIEDIHWADVPSLQLLDVLASRVHEVGILIVATLRDVDPIIAGPLSDALAALARYPAVSRLALPGLNLPEVGQFLAELTGTAPSDRMVAAIHGRTEGNPFFVCELARLLAAHSSDGPAALTQSSEVPVGVRDVIRHRLARLPESTRQLMAVAAVVGREFDLEALFMLSGADHDTTLDRLEPALQARLVIESEDSPTRYRFSHALVSETIYDQPTPIGRARLHLRVGEVLEALHRDDDTHVVELAHHFYRSLPAGPVDRALGYALRAAEAAQGRLAYEQAEAQLRRAVEMARRLPPDQRASRELDVQGRLFMVLMRRGYTSPGVGEAAARARELAPAVRDPLQVAASLMGVAVFSIVSSDYQTAQACGDEMVALGQRADDAMLLLVGHTALGMIGFLRGELGMAHGHHERAMALGDPLHGASLVARSGVHHPSNCRQYAAAVEWLRGEPARARELIAEGTELAAHPGREISMANALMVDAMLGAFAGDAGTALARADQAVRFAERLGFRLYHAFSGVVHGWAVARLGDLKAGEAEIDTWFAVTRELQATCLRPFHLALLADVRLTAGRAEAALQTVEQALGFSASAGDHFWDAELHRLRGELLAEAPDRAADAERSVRKAVAVAGVQGAATLEARALGSLKALKGGGSFRAIQPSATA